MDTFKAIVGYQPASCCLCNRPLTSKGSLVSGLGGHCVTAYLEPDIPIERDPELSLRWLDAADLPKKVTEVVRQNIVDGDIFAARDLLLYFTSAMVGDTDAMLTGSLVLRGLGFCGIADRIEDFVVGLSVQLVNERLRLVTAKHQKNMWTQFRQLTGFAKANQQMQRDRYRYTLEFAPEQLPAVLAILGHYYPNAPILMGEGLGLNPMPEKVNLPRYTETEMLAAMAPFVTPET